MKAEPLSLVGSVAKESGKHLSLCLHVSLCAVLNCSVSPHPLRMILNLSINNCNITMAGAMLFVI